MLQKLFLLLKKDFQGQFALEPKKTNKKLYTDQNHKAQLTIKKK